MKIKELVLTALTLAMLVGCLMVFSGPAYIEEVETIQVDQNGTSGGFVFE